MIKYLLRFVRQTFYFSYSEARGFLFMALVLLFSFVGYLVYKNIPDKEYNSYAEDKALLDSLSDQLVALETQETVAENKLAEIPEKWKVQYFPFDPNTLPADSLQLLGIPGWLARRLDNYRKSGGVFYRQEDLLRIYDFPDSLYEKLVPFIRLKKAAPKKERVAKGSQGNASLEKKRVEKISSFDLNLADSLQLQQIKGIGPVLSGRIVRFRNILGGFVARQQLYEVYGLDTVVANSLMESAFITEDFRPAQLQLNKASQEELMAHPYISPAQARSILAYRRQHGPFKAVDYLLKIHTFKVKFVEKIAPYVRIN